MRLNWVGESIKRELLEAWGMKLSLHDRAGFGVIRERLAVKLRSGYNSFEARSARLSF
jgi:hypothetical protein